MTEQHTQGRLATNGASITDEAGVFVVLDPIIAVARWNAFEPGGAAWMALAAFEALVNLESKGTVEQARAWMMANHALVALRAALVEPGAGAGKEPQG